MSLNMEYQAGAQLEAPPLLTSVRGAGKSFVYYWRRKAISYKPCDLPASHAGAIAAQTLRINHLVFIGFKYSRE